MLKNKTVKKVNVELENDFHRAQSILDVQENTSLIDAYMFVSRKHDRTVTYAIELENDREYKRFLRRVITEGYRNDNIKEEYTPTFKEWKEGKTKAGQRLGRYLRRLKYSDELLDFYSTQEKNENNETVYLTVSPLVQHVVGMSYYATSWSSCQDVCEGSHDNYPLHLGGSILDSHLYVAFIHDDVNDMYSFRARTVLRLFERDNYDVYIGTSSYGDRTTLNACLDEMSNAGFNIYSNERARQGSNRMTVEQELTDSACYNVEGYVTRWYTDEVTRCIEVECLICDGYGDVTVDDDGNEATCPHCRGDGVVEEEVTHYVEEEMDIYISCNDYYPYAEGYSHHGDHVDMYVNIDEIEGNENKDVFG